MYIGYLSKGASEGSAVGDEKRRIVNIRLVIQTLIFTLGLSTAFVIMGFGAGTLGRLMNSDFILIISGAIVILLGMHQIGIFNFAFLHREKKVRIKRSVRGGLIGAYLLGLTFSIGWTPCVGSVLATVLGVAGSQGLAFYAAFLMLIYSSGLSIPFIILSLFAGYLLERFKRLNKYLNIIRIIGGVLIIIMGIILMTNNLNWITSWFVKPPSIS